jgi:hypothetical protein
MAIVAWEGNAPAVKEVSTLTVTGTWATGDTGTLTCGSASVTFTVAATETIAAVVAGLVAAWNASAAPEIAEQDAGDNSPDITLTSETEGIPFIVTASEDTAGSGAIGVQVDTTPNSGPDAWDTAANWSTGVVPVNGDDVILENSAISILYGLAQSGVALASLTRHETFTGTLGLPRTNSNDTSNPYVEYRPTYLAISVTAADLGLGGGSGSGRFNLDTGSNQTTLIIWNSGTRVEAGVPSILWKGTHVDNKWYVNKGDLGIAIFGGETANFDDAGMGFITTQATDATVTIGSGITHKSAGVITIGGGVFSCLSDLENLILVKECAANVTVAGTATPNAVTVYGGTYHWNHAGTVGFLILSDGGEIDFRGDMRAKGCTSIRLFGGDIQDPAGVFAVGGTMECEQVQLSDVYHGPAHQDWTRVAK